MSQISGIAAENIQAGQMVKINTQGLIEACRSGSEAPNEMTMSIDSYNQLRKELTPMEKMLKKDLIEHTKMIEKKYNDLCKEKFDLEQKFQTQNYQSRILQNQVNSLKAAMRLVLDSII